MTPARPRLRLPAAALLVLAAACGGDPDESAVSRPAAVTSSPAASPTASPSEEPTTAAPPTAAAAPTATSAAPAPATPVVSPAGADLPAFGAAGRASEQAASGELMSVVAVRVARQDGFDRVVLELSDGGRPGWRVRYDDAPRRPGSGDPVQVAGSAALTVLVEGVGYPFDVGVPEYAGPRSISPSGTAVVRELRVGAVFEGQYDAYVGVDGRRPYRVFRLEGPPRVVVDVAHTG